MSTVLHFSSFDIVLSSMGNVLENQTISCRALLVLSNHVIICILSVSIQIKNVLFEKEVATHLMVESTFLLNAVLTHGVPRFELLINYLHTA